MRPANDNSVTPPRDLRLPRVGLAGVDIVAGGVHHAARLTLRADRASSGKFEGVTGSNLRAVRDPAACDALAAMFADVLPRGGTVDRIA